MEIINVYHGRNCVESGFKYVIQSISNVILIYYTCYTHIKGLCDYVSRKSIMCTNKSLILHSAIIVILSFK